MGNTLLIRADASTQIGTGHMMRCLALVQAWQDAGGQAIFVTAIEALSLETRLKSEGMEVIHLSVKPGSVDDAAETSDLAQKIKANWVVVDGYHFDSTYQQRVKEAGYQLMVIDDMAHLDRYYADIVLNQNIHAETLRYSCEPYTKLLLGTKYILLRREFLKWRNWNRQIPEIAKKVLVTLGGGDPNNVTLKVIQALQKIDIPHLEVNVIVGSANPHKKYLEDAILSAPCSIRILENVINMPELMAWADLAVSGGGSTCWELAFMGVPAVTLILGENQKLAAKMLEEKGVTLCLGEGTGTRVDTIKEAVVQLLQDQTARRLMAQRGQRMVKGTGVLEVVKYLRVPYNEEKKGDCT